MSFSRKIILFPVLIVITLFPVSCGFKPLFNQLNNGSDTRDIKGILNIPHLDGQEGFYLREQLIRQLGEPTKPLYTLELTLETTKINEVITPSNEITSYRLIMTSNYGIKNSDGHFVLPTQKSVVRTGFSSARNSTGYTTQIAEEAAKKRLAIKIGSEISTRLLILSEKWLQ